MAINAVNKQTPAPIQHKVTLNVKGEKLTFTKWAGTEHRALYGAVAEWLRGLNMDVSRVTMYLKKFKSREPGFDYEIQKI